MTFCSHRKATSSLVRVLAWWRREALVVTLLAVGILYEFFWPTSCLTIAAGYRLRHGGESLPTSTPSCAILSHLSRR
jgi:hypothetical protein